MSATIPDRGDAAAVAGATLAANDLLDHSRKLDQEHAGFQLAYRLQRAGATATELRELAKSIEGLVS